MRRTIASALWTMPAAFLFLIGLTAAREGQAVRQEATTVHHVKISVDPETGTFTYSEDPVHAKRGDRVEWDCEDGNWSVHFIDKTPFAQKLLRGKRRGPKRLPIRGNVKDGSYKYFVAVAVGDDIFTDDPVIIIGPGG